MLFRSPSTSSHTVVWNPLWAHRHAIPCTRCRAYPDNLETRGEPRNREHTEHVVETYDADVLWDVYGIVSDVKVRQTL